MNRLILLIIGAAFILARPSASASNNVESWRVVAYDDARVFIIHPNGVKLINLPETAQQREPRGNINLKLSPDERYVVYSDRYDGGVNLGVFIVDLVMGSIQAVEHSVLGRLDEQLLGKIVMVGPFSPDGRQVAVSVADWYSGTILIVEVSSGEVVAEVDTIQLFNEDNRNYALIPEWTDEGILLYPHCFPCEGFVESFAYRWQPESNSIVLTDIPYRIVNNVLMSDRLAGSGEVLVAGRDINAPTQANPVMELNIIAYYDPDSASGTDAGTVVYAHTAKQSLLLTPRWVADGRAYIVYSQVSSETTLVLRDGTEHSVGLNREQSFVSGTPDGWIMHDDAHFYHYVIAATGDIEIVQIPYVGDAPTAFQFLFVSETLALGNSRLDPPQPVTVIE